MRRIDFDIRVKDEFTYEFISTWVGFDESLRLMNALVGAEEFEGDEMSTARMLVAKCRDILEQKGEAAYTGSLDFAIPSTTNPSHIAYFRVSKVKDDLNTYNVCYAFEDDFIEFGCKYENGILTSMDNAYLGVEWYAYAEGTGENRYAYITSVDTVKMIVDIPEEIEIDGEVLPVKELRSFYCYSYSYSNSSLNKTVLNIPACVEKITLGSYLDVAAINVEAGNPNYNSVDGVLYSKNLEILEKYPSQRTAESYVMLDSVKYIADC